MTICKGKNYPGCRSCYNRLNDPEQCLDCDDESNYDGDDEMSSEQDIPEELSMSELIALIRGN